MIELRLNIFIFGVVIRVFSLRFEFLHEIGVSQNVLDNDIKTRQNEISDNDFHIHMFKKLQYYKFENFATQRAKLLFIKNSIIQVQVNAIQILNKIKNRLRFTLLCFFQFDFAFVNAHLRIAKLRFETFNKCVLVRFKNLCDSQDIFMLISFLTFVRRKYRSNSIDFLSFDSKIFRLLELNVTFTISNSVHEI